VRLKLKKKGTGIHAVIEQLFRGPPLPTPGQFVITTKPCAWPGQLGVVVGLVGHPERRKARVVHNGSKDLFDAGAPCPADPPKPAFTDYDYKHLRILDDLEALAHSEELGKLLWLFKKATP